MSIWDDGYFTEENYTPGYYKDMSPALQRLHTILSGYEPLENSDDNIHMELGIGFGVTINIHAAANVGSFLGNDFNPAQIQYAQTFADVSKAKITLYEKSFEELAARDDLPQCSSISLHGIWNWVSDQNRHYIINIIKKCLKPGGIVYNSYNVSSGHGAFISWRIMMYEYFKQQSGTPIEKTKKSLEYLSNIFNNDETILTQNIVLREEWKRITAQIDAGNYTYLLHEYFNANWEQYTLLEVAERLAEAKLTYISSSSHTTFLNTLFLPETSQKLINAQSTLLEKESLQDNLIRRAFRQDYFIKGGLKISDKKILDYLNKQKFIAIKPAELLTKDIQISFNDDILKPIIECLIKNDYAPKSFDELYSSIDSKKYNHNGVLQVILVLMQSGSLLPCVDHSSKEIVSSCNALNKETLRNFEFNYTNTVMASPVTGAGMYINILQSIYLLHRLKDTKASDAEIITQSIKYLEDNNLSINDADGKKLETKEDMQNYISKEITPIIPIWKALDIIS